MKYLLRYGEIGLKSGPVRRRMLDRLRSHASLLFAHAEAEASFAWEEGRLFVETGAAAAPDLLRRVFGLVSFSPVRETTPELEGVVDGLVTLARAARERGPSFAVRVRRVGDHPYTSQDVAQEAGSAIQDAVPDLEVDLTDPDWEVFAEIRDGAAYLYGEVCKGVGGLPLGSEGTVAALVEGPEGAVAAWLLMKRGCYVRALHREEPTWAQALRPWDPRIRTFRVDSWEEMAEVAEEEGALGFVYPWRLSDLREEDLRPAFYPLVGLDEGECARLKALVLEPAGQA